MPNALSEPPAIIASLQTDPSSSSVPPRLLTPILQLSLNDVLIGRGAPSNTNAGNKRFRDLVQKHKPEYLQTNKRYVKTKIAEDIMDIIIKDRGGRFLRKIESSVEAKQCGLVDNNTSAWLEVSEDIAMQKTKQALRDHDPTSRQKNEIQMSQKNNVVSDTDNIDSDAVTASLMELLLLKKERDNAPQVTLLNSLHPFELGSKSILDDKYHHLNSQNLASGMSSKTTLERSHLLAKLFRKPQQQQTELHSLLSTGAHDLFSSSLHAPSTGSRLNALQQPTALSELVTQCLLSKQVDLDLSTSPLNLSNQLLRPAPPHQERLMLGTNIASLRRQPTEVELELAACRRAMSDHALAVSVTELALLRNLVSYGLPVWTVTVTSSSGNPVWSAENKAVYTWHDFASKCNLLVANGTWPSQGCTEDNASASVQELAIRVVMLLEKVLVNSTGTSIDYNDTSTDSMPTATQFVPRWFHAELSRWASSLSITDDLRGGRPIALSDNDRTAPAPNKTVEAVPVGGNLTGQACSIIISQAAYVTRLRSLLETNQNVNDLSGKLNRLSQATSLALNEQVNVDVDTLKDVIKNGYTGFPSESNATDQNVLSKKLSQRQLETFLELFHVQQAKEDRARILEVTKQPGFSVLPR